jgi:predicted RecB family nuclease
MTDAAALYRPRRDISTVRHQGGYTAKHCPLRVYYDHFPPAGAQPWEPTPAERRRMDAGIDFEEQVFDALTDVVDGAVQLPAGLRSAALRAHTAEAMAAGYPLIIGGELPLDDVGRRVGRPDVLVLASAPGEHPRYHPIDVKHHQALEAHPRGEARVSSLAHPFYADSVAVDGVRPRRQESNQRDLLQLAHYHRMLEACGHATSEPWAGIIGSEGEVVWYRLSQPQFDPRWEGMPQESALQRYDFEFSFRLDVIAAGAAGERIVDPVCISECKSCPWSSLCVPQFHADDCVSLLPRHGYEHWRAYRREGIRSRAQLAELDHGTAHRLGSLQKRQRQNVCDLALEPGVFDDELIEDYTSEAVARTLGITTFGELRASETAVLRLATRFSTSLATAIDDARVVAWADGWPAMRRGLSEVEVPEFDVEIDIDMESAFDGGVYLWGALDDGQLESFGWFGELGPSDEARVFTEFFDWLIDTIDSAEDEGMSIGVFCWNQSAEAAALRRGARLADELAGTSRYTQLVEEFCSTYLVDLMQVVKRSLVTGGSTGLKAIAPLAGFEWADDDPGGENSQVWFDELCALPHGPEREAICARIVQYNHDDVMATYRVRQWLRTEYFPSIADLRPGGSW